MIANTFISNPKWEKCFPHDISDSWRLDCSLQACRKAADDSVHVFTFPWGFITGWADIVLRGRQPYQWIALQDTLCGWTRNWVCICVAPPEMFSMAACRQPVGWGVSQEGEEELLDLHHYNSPRSYAMVSWHWFWPDLGVGAAGTVWQSYMAQSFLPGHVARLSRVFSLLRWFILAPP